VCAAGGPQCGDPFRGRAHDQGGQFGVGLEVGDHHVDGDAVMAGKPAVVVGGHGEGGVGDLRFSGQSRLGVVGHPDHRAAPTAVQVRFCPGGEGGALHAQVSAAAMQVAPLGHQAFGHIRQHAAETGAERIGHGHVGDGTLAEEAQRSLVGAIDELIRHHHVQRPHRFLQRANCRGGEDPTHPQGAQRPDVRSIGDFGGHHAVVTAMAGKEHHLHSPESPQPEAVGGAAEGGVNADLLGRFQALHGIKATTAEHAQASADGNCLNRHVIVFALTNLLFSCVNFRLDSKAGCKNQCLS